MKRFLALFLVLISFTFFSFNISNRLQKKVAKEIKKTFSVEDFSLESISVSDAVNKQLTQTITKENLFKISNNNQLLGYAYVDKAPSKTDEFDYLILLNKELIVAKTKILIYREDYGGEIGSKRWLKQFIGKTFKDTLTYEQDIIAISGATISASSMTIAVNKFLQNLAILHQNKVF
ncbi:MULTISPECIES: FMN-binding protein [Tenacibaculum]|uniref:FMN-binding protein n=1 Tax=Tenacibaculum TaxID=104267 RepID=UPI001F0A74DB|nr:MULTISPECIES: FMN-binding protein [Tenacibaculum]MCH3882956.1 FMN-binding protein [Tenacibaculum aquimarinum]MDO6600782.1 FMN-binding protein [Tenacibaculum sp. 1_MG-2023]